MSIKDFKNYASKFNNCKEFLEKAKHHKILKEYKKETLINLYFSLMF